MKSAVSGAAVGISTGSTGDHEHEGSDQVSFRFIEGIIDATGKDFLIFIFYFNKTNLIIN